MLIFYDRKKHTLNMSRDIMGRIFMIKLNAYIQTYDLRRVAPKIEITQHFENTTKSQQVSMCPLLKFCAKLDPKLQKQFKSI